MKSKWTSTLVAIMAAMVATLATLSPNFATAQELKKVKLSLDFIALGRFAPWYVAVGKGYYKEAGLEVEIVPSQGTTQALQALESGVVQFALTDVAGLVLGRANSTSTAKMLAVVYQKAPYAVYSLEPGAAVSDPKQLQGLAIASGAGSATPKIILGLMNQLGLDSSDTTFPAIDGAARVPALISGQVPAIETFILAKPGIQANVGDKKLHVLLLSDFGLELYSSGLVTKEATIESDPDTVRAFVNASMKGWRDAMNDPKEAATIMSGEIKAIDPEVIVNELELVKTLAVTDDVIANGFGTISAEHFKSSVEFLVENVGMEGGSNLDPAELYTTEFLPTPPIKP